MIDSVEMLLKYKIYKCVIVEYLYNISKVVDLPWRKWGGAPKMKQFASTAMDV